ncbi:MAG TPA: serine/threonine-protein kinase [Gemmataceae bacterium]|nr:serine/threonine-protein kinase [Gemmataceae bacterium]
MDAQRGRPQGHCRPLSDVEFDADAQLAGAPAPQRPDANQLTMRLGPHPRGCRDAPTVDGYEILGEIGRGGMGVVYQARQLKLNRVVALKMILDDCCDRPHEYARFLSEAEVIAGLNHPNIVQIYEIGEADGRPFFSLEFVEGGSLAQHVRGAGPLPPRQAARIIADLARGVDAAHRQGVVHRDLKPANVLLAGGPAASIGEYTPKITDFGLAKRHGDGVKTTAGYILGTPCYMAPEQASGKADLIGPATDVYALGAILYELLAGQPPFHGDTPLVTMQRVLTEDPVAPSHLRRQAASDLETICLKCLQKDGRRRYSGAAPLADDLDRFLDGRTIQARPAAAAERLLKWTRRRPALAAFVGVSLAALSVLSAGGLWHTWQLQEALSATDGARIEAQKERDVSLRARNQAEERERLVREYVYAGQVRQASQLWDHADLRQMRDLLAAYAAPAGADPIRPSGDPREFTWRYLWRLSHADRRTLEGHEADAYFVSYSPDGATLATTGREGTVRLWDAATGAPRFVLRGHHGDANAAAFSPDGGRLSSVGDDGRVIIWDVQTGQEMRRLQDGGPDVLGVAWDPTGPLLAAGGKEGIVYIWDVNTGQQLFALECGGRQVETAAFAPDGRRLACGAGDGGVRIWNFRAGGDPTILETGPCAVETVAWSHDGRLLAAACGDGPVRCWDAATWRLRFTLSGHLGESHGVAFSPDDKTLASGGNDHVIRLWDVDSGALVRVLRGHGERIWSVAFSPDSQTLASASRDHTVKLWDTQRNQEWQELPTDGAGIGAAALDPRGGRVALATPNGDVVLRTLQGDRPPETLPRQSGSPIIALSFSADGRRLAAQNSSGGVAVWDMEDRRMHALRDRSDITFGAISLSADGGVVAVQGADKSVHLLDAATGKELPSPVAAGTECTCLAFSPTGPLLAVAQEPENQIVLFDAVTGTERWRALGHRAPIRCLTFSPDGKSLASGGDDQTLKLWNTADGREITGGLLGHIESVSAAAFHPGGKTIATGSLDYTVKLWDMATGQELATLPRHAGRVSMVAFTADGDALLSVGEGPAGDEVRLWSAAPPAVSSRP